MKHLFTARNYFVDGSSIAATWIWAPAIYVAFETGARWGLWGFLMFWIPNVLGVIVFGLVAHHHRKRHGGFAVCDVFKDKGARALVSTSSFCTLCFSNMVQLTGCVYVLRKYFPWADWQIAAALSVFVFLYSVWGGIKWCVLTDALKYVIFLSLGLFLLYDHGIALRTDIVETSTFFDPLMVFGLSAFFNLMCNIYSDQTFWQRVFSYDQKRVAKTFAWGAGLFALIPLVFGLLGMSYQGTDYNAANVFQTWHFDVIVLTALIATLDSNLCGAESLAWRLREGRKRIKWLPVAVSALLLILANFALLLGLPILFMWLISGTVRLCLSGTVLSAIFNKFQKVSISATCVSLVIMVPMFIYLGFQGSNAKTVLTLGIVAVLAVAFYVDRKIGRQTYER